MCLRLVIHDLSKAHHKIDHAQARKGAEMNSDRRRIHRMFRALAVSAVSVTAAIGAIGPAQAQVAYRSEAPVASAGFVATGQRSAVQLDTDAQPLTATDILLVDRVRQAGMWEEAASSMALTKASSARVRQIATMILAQHKQLDQIDITAAKKLNHTLPTDPTPEQQRWLGEMQGSSGARFDDIYVQRLRAAHGAVFSVIAAVRANTRNDVVRQLAVQSNGFVLNHMSYLESTNLVQYNELPTVVSPASGPLTKAAGKSAHGGIAIPLIWLILAVALIAGMGASTRMIKPRAFGGRHAGEGREAPAMAYTSRSARPQEEYATPYPRPRART
jgi:predicted outer membrane protein